MLARRIFPRFGGTGEERVVEIDPFVLVRWKPQIQATLSGTDLNDGVVALSQGHV